MTELVIVQDPSGTLIVSDVAREVLEVVGDGTDLIEVVGSGPQGIPGPDPWDEPVQELSVSGAVTIDYSLGKHVVLTPTGAISSITVSNWPAATRIARLTFEILNPSGYQVAAWSGVKWPSGVIPVLSIGEDMIVLTTVNGGARTYGHIVGLDYRIPV